MTDLDKKTVFYF